MLLSTSAELDLKRALIEKPTKESVLIAGSLVAFTGWPESWSPLGLNIGDPSLGLVLSFGLLLRDEGSGYRASHLVFDVELADRAVFPTLIASANVRVVYLIESPEFQGLSRQQYDSWYLPGGPTITSTMEQLGLGFSLGASIPPIVTMSANFRTKGSRLKIPIRRENKCSAVL